MVRNIVELNFYRVIKIKYTSFGALGLFWLDSTPAVLEHVGMSLHSEHELGVLCGLSRTLSLRAAICFVHMCCIPDTPFMADDTYIEVVSGVNAGTYHTWSVLSPGGMAGLPCGRGRSKASILH